MFRTPASRAARRLRSLPHARFWARSPANPGKMQFTHWSRGVGRQEAPFQRSLSCVTRWDSDARGSTAGGQNRGGAYLAGALAIASAAAAAVATTCAIESEVPSAESAESPRAESCPVPTACGIDAIDHETKPVLANWSRTVTYTPSRLYLPETVGEIESLVRYAHENPNPARSASRSSS